MTAAPQATIADGGSAEENLLLEWIVRLRWPIFLFITLIHIAAFNGQWRIGHDGSLYRSVAHNLATGQGYTFRGERERHIYPGLPLMLAGVEKVFGYQDPLRPTASLVIMTILGGVTLVVVYHLVRTYFPLWVAVCVTTGVGINREFLHYSHDLMTDLPFLLGTCLVLLGIGRFGKSASVRGKAGMIALTGVGVVIAVSTRPTFWALALAWVGACGIGIIRSPHRLRYIGGLVGIVGLALLWWAMDPRTGGVHPLAGKYESVVASRVAHLGETDWIERIDVVFDKHLPAAMLGIELGFPLGILFSATLLVSSVWLMRVSPLWGLYTLATVAMTLVTGSVSRYYLMALPLMLVAWAQAVHWISQRAGRWRRGPEWVMLLGLGLATVPPMVRCADFVMEQHGITRKFARKTFLEVYRRGEMLPVYRLSELVKKQVPEGQRVLGPSPRILSYLSGRVTYDPSELVDARQPMEWQKAMGKYKPDFAIYGTRFGKENLVAKMIARKVLVVDKSTMVQLEGMTLAPVRVAGGTPAGLAKRLAKYQASTQPATQPATRPAVARTKKSTAATQPATRPARKRAVTTQPTLRAMKKRAAATQPTTRPSKKRGVKASPTTQPVRVIRTTQPARQRVLPATRPSRRAALSNASSTRPTTWPTTQRRGRRAR